MTDAGEESVAGLNVSRETFGKLRELEALVRRWTPAINLVSKATLADLWRRHIVDSAQVFSLCPPKAQSWVDLGAGGGFPGLVVAVLAQELKPGLRVTLVESDLRKATFLRQASQSLGVPVTVRTERIELLAPQSADVLSARALASLADLLGYAARHLQADGVAVFPKGAHWADELAQARTRWAFDLDRRQSLSEADATILEIRNIHRARQD